MRAGLRSREFFESRFRHACFPGWIAQFEPISAWIEKIELSTREITFCAVIEPVDGNLSLVKNLAGLDQRFRAHRKGVVHVLFFSKRSIDARRALAEQNVLIADAEAGHARIAESPSSVETEQIAIKFF